MKCDGCLLEDRLIQMGYRYEFYEVGRPVSIRFEEVYRRARERDNLTPGAYLCPSCLKHTGIEALREMDPEERRRWTGTEKVMAITCRTCGCTKPCGCDDYSKYGNCTKCGCAKPCGCDHFTPGDPDER